MDTADFDGMITYHTNLFTYNKLKGDFQQAVNYADSLAWYKGRREKERDRRIIEQAAMRVQVAKYNADVRVLEAARTKQVALRNASLVIVLLTGLLAFIWIKRIQQKRKTDLENLDKAQKELTRYTRSLIEKNDQIQAFREKLEQQQSPMQSQPADKSHTIAELTHASILTDGDWRHFRLLFDEVYPGFLVRLKEKINDLTPAETRLIALTKLQIADKDMADMLGISTQSIHKSRYRLRKKLNLPEDGSLEELAALI
jgi:DNA-binding CsgD family transcriptional regulator